MSKLSDLCKIKQEKDTKIQFHDISNDIKHLNLDKNSSSSGCALKDNNKESSELKSKLKTQKCIIVENTSAKNNEILSENNNFEECLTRFNNTKSLRENNEKNNNDENKLDSCSDSTSSANIDFNLLFEDENSETKSFKSVLSESMQVEDEFIQSTSYVSSKKVSYNSDINCNNISNEKSNIMLSYTDKCEMKNDGEFKQNYLSLNMNMGQNVVDGFM